MVMMILVAAFFLNFIITSIGLTAKVNAWVFGMGLTPMETLIAVVLFYLILGMFMETLSMMVATVPIITPLIIALGFDPVWFGVLFAMNMQVSFLSPPFGPAAFYLKSVAPPDISLGDIFKALLPFICLQILAVALLIIFPGLAGG